MKELERKVASLPLSPGVYLMKDAQGKVLYVGKAVLLKKRVQSYFSAAPKAVKVVALVRRIHDLEVMVTASELDALILENKKYRPTYNVDLKDDKNYPYVRLQTSQRSPARNPGAVTESFFIAPLFQSAICQPAATLSELSAETMPGALLSGG